MQDQTFSVKDKIIQMIAEEEEEPHAHKAFLTKVPVKATPIGLEFHQIDIPQFDPEKALKPSCEQRKIKWGQNEIKASSPVYLRSKVNEEEVIGYLSFIENYLQQKVPDYFLQSKKHSIHGVCPIRCPPPTDCDPATLPVWASLLYPSRQRTRSMSLQLLHECNYNYTKAKFYILFPYYKTYNVFKCHEPLTLSNLEMEHKINAHIEGLKSSKENDLMKWVKTIENQMESRIHISKISTYMQIARHNKFQIPDSIKDIIDKSTKIGKQIKKNVLNAKNTLQKLQSIKAELQDQKIVTNEMIHFQQAVARAEEWIKKQIKFQEEYFTCEQTESGEVNFVIKDSDFFNEFDKIEYRIIQSLVNEYNSLPLNYPSFVKTTQMLYEDTNKLIIKIPSLNKAAKTRKSQQGSGVVKIGRRLISQVLNQIYSIPVEHEQFVSFQRSITQGLEQLQRISMYMQDTRVEKNLKSLYQYQKLLVDIPIQNDVQKKLNEKIDYYELIDRIRKDISNPAKYDSLKQQLLKLKQKGYENPEHAKLQSRVVTCMGWHDSQQLIREQKKIPNRTYIILNEKAIRSKMIKFDVFQQQLFSARNQLNMGEELLKESEQRLHIVHEMKEKILSILDHEQPGLQEMLAVFRAAYENAIWFLEFQELYQKILTILVLIAKMHYLLNTSDQLSNRTPDFYFTTIESERVIEYICQKKHQIKDLRTKETGDEIITSVNDMNFPTGVAEWRMFQEFMRKAQQWSDRAMQIIEDFKLNNNLSNTREVIEESRHCLHSKLIEEELNKIEIALKWREKIARKMNDESLACYDEEDCEFMQKLERDLQMEENNFFSQQETMFKALEYMHQNGPAINTILQKVASYPTDKVIVLKLSQMNKFVKEIDRQIERYQIKDRVIDELKEKLQVQLALNEDWKERYLAVKRYQKKKGVQVTREHSLRRRDRDEDELQDNQISFDLMKQQKQQDPNDPSTPRTIITSYTPMLLTRPSEPYDSPKRKYTIKNGEFCLYYRMLLMLLEFYNAAQLRFVVEEFVKLKNVLTDVWKLVDRYNNIWQKPDRTDTDWEFLEGESSKIPIFFKEAYLISNKNAQIQAWKTIADHLLKSVPVINMEVKARRPQELRELLQKKKHQELMTESKLVEEQGQETTTKRRRKPNQLYENDEITLFRDDILISKNRKRKITKPTHYHSTANEDHRNKKVKLEKEQHKEERESLQRIEQLLNGGNLQLMIEDPRTYCICRNGILNENSLMVECEQCQEWYHIQCVGIKKHQAKNDESYLCVGCKTLTPGNDYQHGYFWDHHQKITEYALIEIYEQGKSLGVTLTELTKIALVYNCMLKWKQETNQLLKRLIEENPTEISKELGREIYGLYLHSLWLPTVHYEAVHLRRLMMHLRQIGWCY